MFILSFDVKDSYYCQHKYIFCGSDEYDTDSMIFLNNNIIIIIHFSLSFDVDDNYIVGIKYIFMKVHDEYVIDGMT